MNILTYIINKFKKNNMKYWICKDSKGTNLYCGNIRPEYDENEKCFNPVEENYEWIDEDILKTFHIKYPKYEETICKRIFIDIKSKW